LTCDFVSTTNSVPSLSFFLTLSQKLRERIKERKERKKALKRQIKRNLKNKNGIQFSFNLETKGMKKF